MDIELRLEQPSDYRTSENVMREAFWNVYSPGCSEHYLLHIMRRSPNYVKELAYVAVLDGKIVGLVAFMKACILTDGGRKVDVLSMGPIGVLPECQNMDIGRRLIEQAKEEAARLGYRAILLCGEPRYYSKVGFVAAEQYGVRTAENKYFAALQVGSLYDGALDGASGRYFEDEIYNVDEAQVAAFDSLFPAKERIEGTPTQRRFAEVCAMQRDFIP